MGRVRYERTGDRAIYERINYQIYPYSPVVLWNTSALRRTELFRLLFQGVEMCNINYV